MKLSSKFSKIPERRIMLKPMPQAALHVVDSINPVREGRVLILITPDLVTDAYQNWWSASEGTSPNSSLQRH